jgi:hypothetical protein
MKKLMMSFTMAALMGSLVGCVAGDGDGEGEGDETTAEEASALSVGGHYCVNQSFASAQQTGSSAPLQCTTPGGPAFNTTLSNGHPVKVLRNCANPTYVYVQSLWNTSLFYMLRADAFRPC